MSEKPPAKFYFYSPSGAAEGAGQASSPMLTFTVLDVEAVPVDDVDGAAIKTFVLDSPPAILEIDIAIAGGGMGGVAAALAIGLGARVVLTEETAWLGGQMTSQGVAALDENKYVETTGACANYLRMRQAIRDAYKGSGGLGEKGLADPVLNPGTCWVTRLAFEPLVALPILEDMLAPLASGETLTILKRTKIVAALAADDSASIKGLLAVNLDNGHFTEIHCKTVIDATELGDIMPMAQIPYQTGSDSKWLTGEAYAPEMADAENVQDFTYPFVLEYHEGENHVLPKPADYDDFAAAGKFTFDGYKMFVEHDETAGRKRHLLPFWTYRRLIDKELFQPGVYASDLAMINWDSNDLRGKNILDKAPAVQRQYLSLAKRLSLGFCYWLQTEAPRDDDGENGDGKQPARGYPGLKLLYDKLGTKDGLSKYPYIREARRVAAKTTIVAPDIVQTEDSNARARLFTDSCGIGLYPVDIHGHQEIPGAAQPTVPFQVPASALVTDYCPNYIAACKNIGVTHITNGAYRLHPIEWAIGTAAGIIARLGLKAGVEPADFIDPDFRQLQMQIALVEMGAPIFWFEDLPASHEAFAAAQVLSAWEILPFAPDNLRFEADMAVDQDTLSTIEENLVGKFAYLNDWPEVMSQLREAGAAVNRGLLALGIFQALKIALEREAGSGLPV